MADPYLQARMVKAFAATCGLVNNVGPSWFETFENEFAKLYFCQLGQFVSAARLCSEAAAAGFGNPAAIEAGPVYPPSEEVFAWTRMCHINVVRVVIVGQCPYHNPKQACGLAFSVPKGCAVPPSLNNIYRELETDIPGFVKPGHGDLTGWATQGVLLLNSCLTFQGSSFGNSHLNKGWETFTDEVLRYFSATRNDMVFILWGNDAKKKASLIDQTRHDVIQGGHPSPFSANMGHFFGGEYFFPDQCILVSLITESNQLVLSSLSECGHYSYC